MKTKKFMSVIAKMMLLSCIVFVGCGNKEASNEIEAEKVASNSEVGDSKEEPTEEINADTEEVKANTEKKIVIGVSTWSVSDALGSQVKQILDAAANSLGCEVTYVEQEHKSEKVVESVENLCASGVDGIVICNSADTEMSSAIRTCDKNEVYLAQFFRQVTEPEVVAIAKESKYYIGATHEDEVSTGYNLGNILIKDKKARKIGMVSYRVGDATANARIEGYKQAVEEWNSDTAHANEQVTLLPLVDNKYSSEETRQAVEGLIDSNADMDGLIVVGGGGSPLEGALAAISSKGKVGEIKVVSTDFTTTLDKQLESGEIAAMSGGHYADPLFSFLMVYNAIAGAYEEEAKPLDVTFPMIYVSSADDYADFQTYFIENLPYTTEEIQALAIDNNPSTMFTNLQKTAAKLSIEDVKNRHK